MSVKLPPWQDRRRRRKPVTVFKDPVQRLHTPLFDALGLDYLSVFRNVCKEERKHTQMLSTWIPLQDQYIYLFSTPHPHLKYRGFGLVKNPDNPELCTFFIMPMDQHRTIRAYLEVPISFLEMYLIKTNHKVTDGNGNYAVMENKHLFDKYKLKTYPILKPLAIYGSMYYFADITHCHRRVTLSSLMNNNPSAILRAGYSATLFKAISSQKWGTRSEAFKRMEKSKSEYNDILTIYRTARLQTEHVHNIPHNIKCAEGFHASPAAKVKMARGKYIGRNDFAKVPPGYKLVIPPENLCL